MRKSIGLPLKLLCLGVLVLLCHYSSVQAKPQMSPFKVLGFYTNYPDMGDAAHAAFALEANNWFRKVSTANGFIYDSTKNFSDLNATKLANYKVIMFFDNYPGDNGQRNAFETYIKNGGGWIGFHVAIFNMVTSDPNCCLSHWPWYNDTLLGSGLFNNNTWFPTPAILDVEDTSNVITKGFPKTFKCCTNEWYSWKNDLRNNPNIKILCSINPKSFPLGTDPSQSWTSGYYPVVWKNKNYNAMYCNMGHDSVNYSTRVGISKTFSDTMYCKLLLNALKSFAGVITESENIKQVSEKAGTTLSLKSDAQNISISLANEGKISVILSDVNGRVLSRETGINGQCEIDRSKIGPGVYIITAKGANGVITGRISLK